MLQYLAQGACQAINDAAALQNRIAVDAPQGKIDQQAWEGILRAYNTEREPHTSRIQRNARLWESWHVSGIGRILRNELFSHGNAKRGTPFYYTDWLYGESTT